MKRITILLFILLMTGSMMAEKFTLGKLTFQTISAKKVELVRVEKDITDLYLGSTITYNGVKYSVKSIGDEAFSDCSSLSSITIPNSVTGIGDGAFAGCSSLASIIVEKGNRIYDSRNNCNAIITTATNALIAGCYKTIIPNSVTSIGGSAFDDCDNLTSITIPNSVTSIGDWAFFGCDSLTSITIPNSVRSIGNGAFDDCDNLTSITIPNSVRSIENWVFADSITIPSSVTYIGINAFPKHTKIIQEE